MECRLLILLAAAAFIGG